MTTEAMRINPDTTVIPGATIVHANSMSITEIAGWMYSHGFAGFRVHGDDPFGLAVDTPEGTVIAEPGDWIILGAAGSFYPCRPLQPADDRAPVSFGLDGSEVIA